MAANAGGAAYRGGGGVSVGDGGGAVGGNIVGGHARAGARHARRGQRDEQLRRVAVGHAEEQRGGVAQPLARRVDELRARCGIGEALQGLQAWPHCQRQSVPGSACMHPCKRYQAHCRCLHRRGAMTAHPDGVHCGRAAGGKALGGGSEARQHQGLRIAEGGLCRSTARELTAGNGGQGACQRALQVLGCAQCTGRGKLRYLCSLHHEEDVSKVPGRRSRRRGDLQGHASACRWQVKCGQQLRSGSGHDIDGLMLNAPYVLNKCTHDIQTSIDTH